MHHLITLQVACARPPSLIIPMTAVLGTLLWEQGSHATCFVLRLLHLVFLLSVSLILDVVCAGCIPSFE